MIFAIMEEKIKLSKSINWVHVTALTIGAVVGSGPASILSWVLMDNN